MKRVMLISLLAVIAIAGCSLYHTTPLRLSVKPNSRIAIKEFAADSPATARMIQATLAVELQEAGLHIVDVNDSPDLIVDGPVTESWKYGSKYISSVFVIVSTLDDDFVTSIRFNLDEISAIKEPGEIGVKLGKKLAKHLR